MLGVGSPLIVYAPAESTATVWTTGPVPAAALAPVGRRGGGRRVRADRCSSVRRDAHHHGGAEQVLAGDLAGDARRLADELRVERQRLVLDHHVGALVERRRVGIPDVGEPGAAELDPVRARPVTLASW